MKYQIAGTVSNVGKLESLGAKATPKCTFTVNIGNAQYPNHVPLDLWKDAASNPPQVGQKVEASFYVQGREYNGKYYVSLKCAGWMPEGDYKVPSPSRQSEQPARASDFPATAGARVGGPAPSDASGQDDDNLPF